MSPTGNPTDSLILAEKAAITDPVDADNIDTTNESNESSESEAPPESDELTESFKVFLEIMRGRDFVSRTEIGVGGYTYKLDSGSLSVLNPDGVEIWRTGEELWVDDFRLGDVDGDGEEDFVFSLWKSYRFGNAHPARMTNNDERVRNHLFIYTIILDRVKAVWCSSDLPHPIYSFELDPTGRVTRVSSGMLLRTQEGEYRDDFIRTAPVNRVYAWEKWGFVPILL